ncbi:MAG: CehA/McbA family metallohydrolase [Chloroflexi bacterium]|nr:CehA/McbA family metallohydrolase [Chloroflexota bacterium]
MPEIVGNLHLHTTASDGTGSHDEVAAAAARAGLDFIVYTDHNIAVEGIEGWYRLGSGGRQILRLMGQEVNDMQLVPELNHLLCHFVGEDFQYIAANPQALIDAVNAHGGITFLAHPLERPGLGAARETYPWISWEVSGFTGIESWNAMTDVKWQLRTTPRAVIGAYLSNLVLTGPFPEVLAKWDELLATGQKVVAIGNSDAHAMSFSLGPLRRTVYPYEYLFRAVNTHLLVAEPLGHEVGQARQQIYEALKLGHCFVSYDLIASSRGFSFTGTSGGTQVNMGDTLPLQNSATLAIFSPHQARVRLLHNGWVVAETNGRELVWETDTPGVYRVEAYRQFWGWQRGWVFTNPIYLERST